ncbi:MAG: zinc metallopeptidase [Bacteroidales bacterium]|nr:zinc metallopeptidase [Bacteroidales bacterium]
MLNTVLLQATAVPVSGSTLMWGVFIILTVVSMVVSKNVERKFKKYSHIRTEGSLTGREVAERMLRDHDIHNVQVQMVKGTLTDHYNPTNRTLNLSPDVYNGTSVAAAAVAAHECGHAVQHAVGYAPLGLRSALVPIVSFAGRWVSWVILAGLLLIKAFPSLMLIGILMFALTTLFSIVTLPVEINASNRALQWIRQHDITSAATHQYAESALRSAAYTYVMSAVTSLATLAYYVMIYLDRK